MFVVPRAPTRRSSLAAALRPGALGLLLRSSPCVGQTGLGTAAGTSATSSETVRPTGTDIDRVATQCVNTLTPKWATRLVAFDVYVWDQCYAMEQSLRID